MEFEERITKIERVSVRIFGLVMLFLALLGLLTYGAFELIKFISNLWASWYEDRHAKVSPAGGRFSIRMEDRSLEKY